MSSVCLYCCRKANGDIEAPHLSPVLSIIVLLSPVLGSIPLCLLSYMEQTVRFWFLIDHEVKKLTLSSGIPSTVDKLVSTVKEHFSIPIDISLQYKDEKFDDFFTLSTTNELKDKDTLKVMHAPLDLMLTAVPLMQSMPDVSDVISLYECQSLSGESVMLSPSPSERQSPCPFERQSTWPAVFPIPTFLHNTELALRQGNQIYLRDGTQIISPSVKSDILERRAEAMFSYTAYPNDAQRCAVAEALVAKHPCLKIFSWNLWVAAKPEV